MTSRTRAPAAVSVAVFAAAFVAACGSSSAQDATFGDVPNGDPSAVPATDFGRTESPPPVDPYAKDPPPEWCGPGNGAKPPPVPGGTESCPSDKNKPGCACDTLGQKAACWTGLRANRGLGICKDGVATCLQRDETTRTWGSCEGQVLPTAGQSGKSACTCFSEGEWKIDNLVACTASLTMNGKVTTAMVSAVLKDGKPQCPDWGAAATPTKPTAPWSSTSLKVDCAGDYELCYELKAGDGTKPTPFDCSIAKVCQKAQYTTAGVEQPIGDLPSWISTNDSCIASARANGSYGEMTVKGLSVQCDAVDDGKGNPKVFNRVNYCPERCSTNPSLPECAACRNGGSGQF